ncbi:T9SS-dependent M36 family metallopeptidase [Pontibacter arcticus]|uniref:Metalloprotease n=1 Tax=Pontibacter arcticus TaxID=2080288 RepID=A0A364RCU3_9BACT|nr:T9SS-dependent M36 family metallopeptidase [Pontibacter arcticus]RAU82151.1 metalloprotease [Pontibacter arcticus]
MRKALHGTVQLMLLVVLLLGSNVVFGQRLNTPGERPIPKSALEHIKKNRQKLDLTEADIAEMRVSSESQTKHNGLRHVYLQQLHEGIEIYGAVSNVNLTKDEKVLSMGNRFRKDLRQKAKTTQPGLNAEAAVAAAAKHLGISLRQPLVVKERSNAKNKEVLFSTGGISLEPIPAKLVYQPQEDGSLKLAWEVSIYELDAQNWWNIRLDAVTGKVLDKDNMVVHCQFDNDGPAGTPLHREHSHTVEAPAFIPSVAALAPTANAYNVYAMPVESPSHGPRSFVSTSSINTKASPYGWHSTLVSPAIEYTITRGNNVHAYEDPSNNNNITGLNYSTDGGQDLLFDFPVDFTKQPVEYRDAAITNLFYVSNVMHDVWYQYGFDELSGNFQTNNYDKGGLGGDYVQAEAQDSRNIATTRNNANFSTPRDGLRPRMQMYLWSGKAPVDILKVTAPSGIAGNYKAIEGSFSKPLTTTPVVGKLVLAQVETGSNDEACTAYTNGAAMSGNIAVVYRGACDFAVKTLNAQNAGAIAIVVINNADGDPIIMGGTPTSPVTIPAVMISKTDGLKIRQQLDASQEVTVSLQNNGSGPEVDGDFDNGIIAHEYGHGISIRLTGGPNLVNCLGNAEQAGEGWSDWFGLMITMKPGDKPADKRGVGTYAQNQPTDGNGIRPAPYSTDFAINGYTYGATNNTALSQPHGIGFVWATMIWDLNWAMIEKYGYDADLYNGKGGNNMAMQLIIDGLKLQPCGPGFVDARNAILAADLQNYGGANQQLIWSVFARRGLGFSASQGLATSRTDQVEAFDMPPADPSCQTPVISFALNGTPVEGTPENTIYLGKGPQTATLTATGSDSYVWTPATGLSDAKSATPVFTATAVGTYTYTVTGRTGNCVKDATITIKVVEAPIVCDVPQITVKTNGTPIASAPANTIYIGYGPQSVTLSAKAGDSNSFAWSPATDLKGANTANAVFTPKAAGTYTFTVTASKTGCSSTASVTINVLDVRCGNKVAMCFRGKDLCVNANTVARSLERGYTLGSCSDATPVASEPTFKVYPNPVSSSANIDFTLEEDGAYAIKLVNQVTGEIMTVATGKGKAGDKVTHQFNRGRLSNGTYTVMIESASDVRRFPILLSDK